MTSRRLPSFPDPPCALVLPLVRRVPAETGDVPRPPPPLSNVTFMTGFPPTGHGGLKTCRWNQNCIQMIRLNREAVASPVL